MSAPPVLLGAWMGALPAVRHGFFGRAGGVSEGLYASLNTGRGSRDAPEAVAENRRRCAAGFGLPAERLLGPYQVHSATVLRVDAPWDGPAPEADGLVTRTPGLLLSVVTADCAPVLLADAKAGVVGAVHAGWKGLLGGVLEAGLLAMLEAGAAPADIHAAIGPCIAQASYEVGPELQARFLAADSASASFFAPGVGDRLHFDLAGACAARLRKRGLARVEVLERDTCALEQGFFSNRRAHLRGEADYGRNLSAIALRAPA